MTARPGYKEAVRWIALNDDVEFLKDEECIPSVAVCLVADLWAKETDSVVADLKRVLSKINR